MPSPRLNRKTFLANIALAMLMADLSDYFQTPALADQTPSRLTTPQQILIEFYQWYISEFNKNHQPFVENRARINQYVAKSLVKTIDRQIKSPDGLSEDYFVQAQDDQDDWATNIAVSNIRNQGGDLTAIVTLGATPETLRRLAVRMRVEDGRWKITAVGEQQPTKGKGP